MPEVFEGNPTFVSLNSGNKLRKIQWGSDVYVAANFDVSGNQAVTLPSGTWYDYLAGGTPASGTYTLAPGELKVFTGRQVVPPTFSDINKRDNTPIENVTEAEVKAYKVVRDGQVLILRGDKVYTITGQLTR